MADDMFDARASDFPPLPGEPAAEADALARVADRLAASMLRTVGTAPTNVTVNIATPNADTFRRSEAYLAGQIARAVARGQRVL